MTKKIKYQDHPDFQEKNPYTDEYGRCIGRLNAVFAKDDKPKAPLMAEAREILKTFTPRGCRERFGLGSGYSLAKEFYYDIVGGNAAAVARVLEQVERAEEARSFLFEIYAQILGEGFDRDTEFFANRLDSRTFMPMRRHIDREYLDRIGFRHPDNVLLSVGDCQTMLTSEKIRDQTLLQGMEIASYQHSLGSLIESPLEQLFKPGAFYWFVNAAANYGIFARDNSQRQVQLDSIRQLVDWLKRRQPRLSLFVTHVYFGIENAIQHNKVPREVAMDAVTTYSDEVAAILAQAPGARLVNFQEICPMTGGTEMFRDDPKRPNLLHFKFDVMERVTKKVTAALAKGLPGVVTQR